VPQTFSAAAITRRLLFRPASFPRSPHTPFPLQAGA
jgi:hypothetical protein